MTTKEAAIITGNLVLAAVALVLFAEDKMPAEQLFLVLGAIGFPSAASMLGRPRADGGVLVLVLGAAAAIASCATLQSTEAEAEAAYAGEHAKCASTEPSREAVDACRARVRERWGITVTNARAAKDGGR